VGSVGAVTQIVNVDDKSRTIWFNAVRREASQDPYFSHLYRVGLDGRNAVSVTPDTGDHSIQLSPSGRYVIDSYSRPDVPAHIPVRSMSAIA